MLSLAYAYTYASYHALCDFVVQHILYRTAFLLDRPLVGLEQDGIRERYEVCGEHSDDVTHARYRSTRSVVDDLFHSQPVSEECA